MSSMLSAPATIPATFRPGCAPLSVGTDTYSSAKASKPHRCARPSAGFRPAEARRLRSSNAAAVTGRVWDSCTLEMPFVSIELVL
jgi:hypothetical protein